MDAPRRQAWIRAALLAGLAYFLIGRLFAGPATGTRLWRLAAWVISGAVFAAQIWYEHFRLRSAPRSTALHAALAVAMGAFLLALVGMIRSLSAGPSLRPVWFLALLLWPAVTAAPAFLVAFAVAAILARLPRSADTR